MTDPKVPTQSSGGSTTPASFTPVSASYSGSSSGTNYAPVFQISFTAQPGESLEAQAERLLQIIDRKLRGEINAVTA